MEAIRVRAGSSLELLGKRRSLTLRQFRAGLRLEASYRLGVLGLHGGGGGGPSPGGFADARQAAAQDYAQARDAIGGRLWPVVWGVVCDDRSVQEVSFERHINPTACMALLKLALDLLADHYRIPEGT